MKLRESIFFFLWPEARLTNQVDVRHSDASAPLCTHCNECDVTTATAKCGGADSRNMECPPQNYHL